jgi:hypothetical protein
MHLSRRKRAFRTVSIVPKGVRQSVIPKADKGVRVNRELQTPHVRLFRPAPTNSSALGEAAEVLDFTVLTTRYLDLHQATFVQKDSAAEIISGMRPSRLAKQKIFVPSSARTLHGPEHRRVIP